MGQFRSKQKRISISGQTADICSEDRWITRADFKMVRRLHQFPIDMARQQWVQAHLLDEHEVGYLIRTIDKQDVLNNRSSKRVMLELWLLERHNDRFIRLYFAFHDKNKLYTVYEPLRGCSLEHLIKSRQLDQNQAKFIVCTLVTLLEQIHSRGMLLTNLCPENLWIDYDKKRIKLIQMLHLVKIGDFCNQNYKNLGYCAPQVLMMDRVYMEADYYSLGLIMYEMMTREKAIVAGMLRKEIAKQTVSVSKSDLPEGWAPQAADFLIKLLVKAPELRLGRLGCFQLRNHPWLLNFDWDELKLGKKTFIKAMPEKIEQNVSKETPRDDSEPLSDSQLDQYYFVQRNQFQQKSNTQLKSSN